MSASPDFIPDESAPEWIPEDQAPEYISPEGETEEERQKKLWHMARLKALSQPSPQLELSPMEQLAGGVFAPTPEQRAAEGPTYGPRGAAQLDWFRGIGARAIGEGVASVPALGTSALNMFRGLERIGANLAPTPEYIPPEIGPPIDPRELAARNALAKFDQFTGGTRDYLGELARGGQELAAGGNQGFAGDIAAGIATAPAAFLKYGAMAFAGPALPLVAGGVRALEEYGKPGEEVTAGEALKAGGKEALVLAPYTGVGIAARLVRDPAVRKIAQTGGVTLATFLTSYAETKDVEKSLANAISLGAITAVEPPGPRRPYEAKNFTPHPDATPEVANFTKGVADAFAELHPALAKNKNVKFSGEQNGDVTVKLPEGSEFTVSPRGVTTEVTTEAKDKWHRDNPGQDAVDPVAKGLVHVVDGRALLELASSRELGTTTPWHEGTHLARKLGAVAPDEWSALVQKFSPGDARPDGTQKTPLDYEEDVANGVEAAKAGGPIRQGIRKLGEGIQKAGYSLGLTSDKPLPNVMRIVQQLQRGEMLTRPGLAIETPREVPEFIPEKAPVEVPVAAARTPQKAPEFIPGAPRAITPSGAGAGPLAGRLDQITSSRLGGYAGLLKNRMEEVRGWTPEDIEAELAAGRAAYPMLGAPPAAPELAEQLAPRPGPPPPTTPTEAPKAPPTPPARPEVRPVEAAPPTSARPGETISSPVQLRRKINVANTHERIDQLEALSRSTMTEGGRKTLADTAMIKHVLGVARDRIGRLTPKQHANEMQRFYDATGGQEIADMTRAEWRDAYWNLEGSKAGDRAASNERADYNYDAAARKGNKGEVPEEFMPSEAVPEPAFKLSPKEDADNQKIHDTLRKRYGTTDDLTARGWVLPDGTIVPIGKEVHENTKWEDQVPHLMGRKTIPELTSRGIARVDPKSGAYEFAREPTPPQIETTRAMMEHNGVYSSVDMNHGMGTENPRKSWIGINPENPQRGLGMVSRFYQGENIEPGGQFKLGPREDTSLIDTPGRRNDRIRWLEQLSAQRGFADPEDASRKIRPMQQVTIMAGGDPTREAHRNGAVLSDPNEAARLIPESGANPEIVTNEATSLAHEIALRAIEKGQNLVVNRPDLTKEQADALQQAFEANGYKVTRVGASQGAGAAVQPEIGTGTRPAGGPGAVEEGRVRPAPAPVERAGAAEEAKAAEGRLGGIKQPSSTIAPKPRFGTKNRAEMESVWDDVLFTLPAEIRAGVNVKSVRTVQFPLENEGEGGRLERDPGGGYHIFLEEGWDVRDALRHEILHAYEFGRPKFSAKYQGYDRHERAVADLEKTIKAMTPAITPTVEKAGEQIPQEGAPAAGIRGGIGPGTQRAGEREVVLSPIQQLGQTLDHIKLSESAIKLPEKPPLPTIGARAKVKAEKAAGIAQRVWKSYAGHREWTPQDDIMGDYLLANTESRQHSVEFAKKSLDAVPDPLTWQAMNVWREARGNEVTLKEWADKTSDPELKPKYQRALDLSPDEKTFAENSGNYFADKFKSAADAGVLENALDDFVPHIWEPKVDGSTVADAKFSGYDPTKGRVLPTYFEGEQLGFKPKNPSLAYLTAIYNTAIDGKIADAKLREDLLSKTAQDGRPLAVEGKRSPVGYELGKGRGLAGLWLHPDIATRFNNAMIARGAISSTKAGKAVLDFQRNIKDTMVGLLNPFHQVQIAVHGLEHKVYDPFHLAPIDLSVIDQRQLVRHSLDLWGRGPKDVFEAAEGLGGGGGYLKNVPWLGDAQARYSDKVFNDFIPREKMAMALQALERNRERFADKMSEDQIYHLTAIQANAAFKGSNLQFIGRNKTFQEFLQLATFAPQFLEGRARFVGQALKPEGIEQRAALLRGAFVMYLSARIMNAVFNKDKNGNPDPKWETSNAFSIVISGRKYGIRTVQGDVLHLLTDPRNFAYNRMSPGLRAVAELVTGRDQYGRKVSTGQQAWDIGTSPAPFGVAAVLRELPRSVKGDDPQAGPKLLQAGTTSLLQMISVQSRPEYYGGKTKAEQTLTETRTPGPAKTPEEKALQNEKWNLIHEGRLAHEEQRPPPKIPIKFDKNEADYIRRAWKADELIDQFKSRPQDVKERVWNDATREEQSRLRQTYLDSLERHIQATLDPVERKRLRALKAKVASTPRPRKERT